MEGFPTFRMFSLQCASFDVFELNLKKYRLSLMPYVYIVSLHIFQIFIWFVSSVTSAVPIEE